MEKIYSQNWVDLPKEVRQRLSEVFGIERTGITEVRDQTVISDGYTNTDLQAITLEKMEEYIGSKETFHRAWELTLAKVKYELNPPTIVIGEGELKDKEESNEKTITKKSK